jgi:hypothetical protein
VQHPTGAAVCGSLLLWIVRKAPRPSALAITIIGLPHWWRAACEVARVRAQRWRNAQIGSANVVDEVANKQGSLQ